MFNAAHLWQTLRILAACAIAYGASWLIGLHEGYWALVTAVVVTQPGLGETLAAGRDRVIGTLIGASAGLAVIAAAQLGGSTVPLFWVALAPLAVLAAAMPNLRLCCITLVIVVLAPSSGPPFERPLQRIAEILLGTFASVLVSAAIQAKRADAVVETSE